ncbi:hypothetical protein [Cloacibacillus evryensis]|uniref:hypothetical protein n=1 Tax=Cloacibacillus evryensis TaxID=508460 RepID=UPI0012EA1D5E|nr:hypothetical protein [Cloacibacillus evryensis]
MKNFHLYIKVLYTLDYERSNAGKSAFIRAVCGPIEKSTAPSGVEERNSSKEENPA